MVVQIQWRTDKPREWQSGLLSCCGKDGASFVKTIRLGQYYDGSWHFDDNEIFDVEAWAERPAFYMKDKT